MNRLPLGGLEGQGAQIAWFCEAGPDSESLRLAAAVAWRGVPTPAALIGGGGPLGWLRGVRHRLWLRLGPLGLSVTVNGRPLFGGASGTGRSVASAGGTSRRERLAYYDDASQTLRVLGRVLAAPPVGLTLVALVDASGSRATWPRLVLRNVPTPLVPMPTFDPPPTPAAGVGYIVVGEDPAWTAALRADHVVRSFLDDADHAPAGRA